jgi:vesicle coat complex subunit
LAEDDPNRLLQAVLGVSMCDSDWEYAQRLCVRLSRHPHSNVRGNAILGFAHIARVHRRLDELTVKPIVELALGDQDPYVVGQAIDAIMDTEHYLGWKYDQRP